MEELNIFLNWSLERQVHVVWGQYKTIAKYFSIHCVHFNQNWLSSSCCFLKNGKPLKKLFKLLLEDDRQFCIFTVLLNKRKPHFKPISHPSLLYNATDDMQYLKHWNFFI